MRYAARIKIKKKNIYNNNVVINSSENWRPSKKCVRPFGSIRFWVTAARTVDAYRGNRDGASRGCRGGVRSGGEGRATATRSRIQHMVAGGVLVLRRCCRRNHVSRRHTVTNSV